MSTDIVLESASLRLVVRPQVGGTITEIRHKGTGLSVLGQVPWQPVAAPLEPAAAPDERTWLTRYTGGWPLLFPNGGDACVVDGVFHGFHGEASIAPWDATLRGGAIGLERRMTTVPVRMTRVISIDDDVVTVREVALNEGTEPIAVMWGHHPTFGADLLAGTFEITAGAPRVTVDAGYDPPANPLRPGASGQWPWIDGKEGAFDLRQPMTTLPAGRMAALAYLTGFERPWIAIRRLDDAIATALSWDATIFPCAWIWFEIEGTPETPWDGRTRLVGLEPNTTPLAYGLAEARRRGARLMMLDPNVPVQAEIRLRVFKPSGNVTVMDASWPARP